MMGTTKPIITGFAPSAGALFLLSTISMKTSTGDIGLYFFLFGRERELPIPR
jgi:hypothetical protein